MYVALHGRWQVEKVEFHSIGIFSRMTSSSPSLTLKQAFESTFHSKYNFGDFLVTTASNEVAPVIIHKGTVHQTTVYSASEKLRRFHKFLNKFVFDYLQINTQVADAYLPGKNTRLSINKHATNKYFFQTDFSQFFTSLSIPDIQLAIKKVNNAPIIDLPDHDDLILNLVTLHNSLPIGFATSPSLSNACMTSFDNSMQEYCIANQIIYSRYSDDLIFSSMSQKPLQTIQSKIEELLHNLFDDRLKLNPKKTKFLHPGNKVKLLGVVILPNGTLSIDSKMKSEIEVLFHFYLTDQEKYDDYLLKTFENKISQVTGRLRYISTVDQAYLLKLRKRYGNLVVDLFMNGSETQ